MTRETFTLTAPELRFASDDEATFSGYAAVFGVSDSYGDVIAPGAFKRTLAEHRAAKTAPAMFWNHDTSKVIGVWTELREDARGLAVSGRLIRETVAGGEAYHLLKAGAVNGLSIGFRARGSKRGSDGRRNVTDIELIEISPVPLPGQTLARVTSVRSAGVPGAAAFLSAASRAAHVLKGKPHA